MLPETEDLQSDELVEETVYPNDTYILDFENKIIRRISDDDESDFAAGGYEKSF